MISFYELIYKHFKTTIILGLDQQRERFQNFNYDARQNSTPTNQSNRSLVRANHYKSEHHRTTKYIQSGCFIINVI